ncbi:MAG: ArsJ-associated glyceraldehyde-3-phosphate dehydrogenase [Gammaproteobacteria bacterium]|nr:ArsJ-associated glyceraldehyde-3-phosphate dehydrogenase [Gammaproteobacteria bacterium]MDP2139984.1 ArsJ-associated glyceraldehyde-3-phosphate dehydrogenase [Gammaproteobacteria bacterium]MDP2347804.1 ArsJ-associated glyceraldehyde-3-phosphate dehydrogenase [Gammaproteobacteria bacterium]
MTTRIAINGFGRMGRLALRAAWDWPDIEIMHINELAGSAADAAHLLKYDSQHGIWPHDVSTQGDALLVNGKRIGFSRNVLLEDTNWAATGADVVVECTGKFKSSEALQPYFKQGIRKVVVSAPIKDGTLNIVMGVNDHLYDPATHHIVTAASCTTNCLAPVVDVIHRTFGIRHGSITTVHDITNTQTVLDGYHKDLRRARACGMSLIPTSTGSATAITEIFPELKGRLNGIAVRVPITNASLTDCVFEVEKPVTVEKVNAALKEAADGRLQGILGYEERPLVSVDYLNDPRSSIIDALSTMVINHTQVKILAWYDNEIGYVHRMMELALKVGRSIQP